MSYLFKFYSKQYDGFMKIFKLDKNEAIIDALGDVSNKVIADIGGGTGSLADKLINLGAKVIIVDPEKKMTDIAKVKNKKVNVLNEYSNKLSLDNEAVDIVIMRDAFHHIIQQKETLEECKRILKKNGQILICEFDKNHIISKFIALFEICCFEKIKMVTKSEIKEFGKVYFKDERIISTLAYEFIYLANK